MPVDQLLSHRCSELSLSLEFRPASSTQVERNVRVLLHFLEESGRIPSWLEGPSSHLSTAEAPNLVLQKHLSVFSDDIKRKAASRDALFLDEQHYEKV